MKRSTKRWQEGVAGFHAADLCQPQLLHEAVLQCAVGAFDTTLGLTGVGAQDLDVQLSQGTAELRHALTALGALVHGSEDGVLVGVERDRASVGVEIAAQRGEVRVCALAGNEAQLHQPACSVVDEHQQRAGLAAALEPAVIAAVDLNQFAIALPSQARLMEGPALLAGQPQAIRRHPLAHGLPAHLNAVPLL